MIIEARHSPAIISITISKLFERIAYYGVRSILILYMFHSELAFSEDQASVTFGIFSIGGSFLALAGGWLGDFLLGIRLASITGLAMQTAGCFLLATPNTFSFYTGLFLVALGTSLYTPNIMATLGFKYRSKQQLMDAAFLILYTVIVIGAMLAPLIVGFMTGGIFWIAFIISGCCSLIALLVLLFSYKYFDEIPLKRIHHPEQSKPETNERRRNNATVIKILLIPILFSLLLQIPDDYISDIGTEAGRQLGISNFTIITNAIKGGTTLIFGLILSIIWSYVYIPSYIKIVVGFIILAISSFFFAATLSTVISNKLILFIATGMFVRSIAELFVSANITSYICRYAPVKYTSTLIGLGYPLSYLVMLSINFIFIYTDRISFPVLAVITGAIAILVAVFFYLFEQDKKGS